MERRRFIRIPFANRATLIADGQQIQGQVTDLSLNGLRLEAAQILPEKTPLTVRLQLGADGSDWEIAIPGRALQHDDGAMAVQFDLVRIDDRDLVILKRILALAQGDERLVQREYKNYMAALIKRKKKLRKLSKKRAGRKDGGPE